MMRPPIPVIENSRFRGQTWSISFYHHPTKSPELPFQQHDMALPKLCTSNNTNLMIHGQQSLFRFPVVSFTFIFGLALPFLHVSNSYRGWSLWY